ncbi:MAG: rRNA maturation RNase YbeY [Saprospiraceae bacterium]|nr:rRNA maturation RNase YbeY [Saprospiraceae bacterium]
MFPQQDAENTEIDPIQFFTEDITFLLEDENLVREWIMKIINEEGQHLVALTFVFCSDAYLHNINIEYLDHDTLTDIITFPYQEPPNIEGDIFISIDRIKDNANSFETTFENELRRVIIHGVYHLSGYGDKSEEEAKIMRQKENHALEQWNISITGSNQ